MLSREEIGRIIKGAIAGKIKPTGLPLNEAKLNAMLLARNKPIFLADRRAARNRK